MTCESVCRNGVRFSNTICGDTCNIQKSREKGKINVAKYRKLPVEIEAFQFDGDLIDSRGRVYAPDWAWDSYQSGVLYYGSIGHREPCDLYIHTLEGDMHVSIGDWIIKGVNGELYPCKPNIFAKTYEVITE